MLVRERCPMPARALLRVAPLPSLQHALPVRATVFGPVDLDEAPAASYGLLRGITAGLRGLADLLEPRVRP